MSTEILKNEHIEYFKRFARCYLKWSHHNMDRIVADVVKRQERIKAEEDEAKRREKFKNSPMGKMLAVSKEWSNKYIDEYMKDLEFMKGGQWDKVKIGSKLKIKLPS